MLPQTESSDGPPASITSTSSSLARDSASIARRVKQGRVRPVGARAPKRSPGRQDWIRGDMQVPPPELTCSLVMRRCRNFASRARIASLPVALSFMADPLPWRPATEPPLGDAILGRHRTCPQIPNCLHRIPCGYVILRNLGVHAM